MKPTNTQLGYESPPGFGLRQSSAALEARAHPVLKTSIESEDVRLVGKRQRTAAVQNAIARLKPPSRMGPFVGRLSMLGKHLTGTALIHAHAAFAAGDGQPSKSCPRHPSSPVALMASL